MTRTHTEITAAKVITIDTDHNVYKALDKTTALNATQIGSQPYNWNQGVTIKADNVALQYVDPATGNTISFQTDPAGVFRTSVENEVGSVSISIKKVDIGNTNKLLENAVFSLYDSDAVDGSGKLKPNAIAIQPEITTDTGTDLGFADLGELNMGTYYLVETAAPAGYMLPEYEYIKITVGLTEVKYSAGASGELKKATTITRNKQQVYLLEVFNSAGVELPSTGGRGTRMLYLIGSLLLLGSIVLLVRRRITRK